jgi:hypothetical protein
MRFLVMVMLDEKAQKEYEAGYFGNPELFEEMAKYNQELVDAGVMLSGDGLHPTPQGARVEFGDGGPTVTDGPFPESKELLGGYWIFKTNSKQEAVDWARRAPMQKGDVLVIRRIMEMDEFTEELQKAAELPGSQAN